VITGKSRQAASPSPSPSPQLQLQLQLQLQPQPSQPPTRTRSRRRTLTWAAGTAVAAGVLFTCYLRQSRTVSVGSDGASQALQAWDMLHGNLLLHGWWVTDVPFYTTEVPQYAAIELVRGLSADVMHVAGAMTYTLLVLTAAFLARGRATGPAGVTRALLAAGLMLAPQLGAGTQTLVLSPDHTGTAVPVLLIWLLIDRAPTRWYVPAAVWLGLALTTIADAMTLFVAVLPLALVCSLLVAQGALKTRAATNGALTNGALTNGKPPRGRGCELTLLAAAVLAVPAELAATALIRAVGGWQVHGLATELAGAGRLAQNARLTGEGLLELFGANVFGAASTGSALAVAFAIVHLVGVALAVAGVVAAARRLAPRTGPADLIEAVLLAGILVNLVGYLAGVQAVDISSTREIAPILPFVAVLAGRTLGARLLGDRTRYGRTRYDHLRPALSYALSGVLALYAAMLGYAAAQPPAPPQYADLAAWLTAHRLTEGLSGYHQANIVTLESGGTVTLRAVAPTHNGKIGAYAWNASISWFDPAAHTAHFLVLTTRGQSAEGGGSPITVAEAAATFGRPAELDQYHAYIILIWPRGDNLLARLR
jgi:hypothetical protein